MSRGQDSSRKDFAVIARGFAIGALDLGSARDAVRTLAQALGEPGPCLVNVPIPPGENVYPMVPPGGANREMIGGEIDAGTESADRTVVLRLLVRNHPGVMSHVCGLFARRAFNVDGIICMPARNSTRSIVVLMVNEDDRLEQMIAHSMKLGDVLEIHRAPNARHAFAAVAGHLEGCDGVCLS